MLYAFLSLVALAIICAVVVAVYGVYTLHRDDPTRQLNRKVKP